MSEITDISINDYAEKVRPTDKLTELRPVLKGLFGEVGSLITVSKKQDREGDIFKAYQGSFSEELGDVFWYITAICRRKNYNLEKIVDAAKLSYDSNSILFPPRSPGAIVSQEFKFTESGNLEDLLFDIGKASAALLDFNLKNDDFKKRLIELVTIYLKIVQASKIPFQFILKDNQNKARGRFLKPKIETLPSFDITFPEDERLPRKFEIEIREKQNGKTYLRWNNVFIGDPLTDNIADKDGYRFHDVFHFSHAAILHWSPVFRALIKHKRKSDPKTDENQDSGRAIVIEEGVSAYIFSYAKQMDFFENQNKVSFDLLKTISNFVKGYEVESCPLYMWEEAILKGYAVFRELKANKGGIIMGNLDKRTIKYKPLK